MTRAELFARGVALLKKRSSEARLDVTRLLEHVLGLTSAALIAHGEKIVDQAEVERFDALIARRANGEPIAYLCGEVWFYGRPFKVDAGVLIPRPETELMIELALQRLHGDAPGPRILDVGTGSGAIAVTLALECSAADVCAVDISDAALSIAAANAEALQVADRVRFVSSDLCASLGAGDPFDCIVANLPYLRSADVAPHPDSTAFEPRLALDGGVDGIELYRRLFTEIPDLVDIGSTLLLEAAPPTMQALNDAASAAFPHATITLVRDYAGLERVLIVEF